MKKWLMWLLIALVLGLALLYWGARYLVDEIIGAGTNTAVSSSTTISAPVAAPTAPAVRPTAVEVVPVRQQLLTQQVTAVGSLVAQQSAMLRAESSGRIAQILFEEGMPTVAGQLLVQLDTDLLKAELQQAQAQLALAQSRASRAQKLSKEGFISAQAQDESNSERAVAAAQVNIIKTKIDKSQIKAPFDGVLGLRYINVGDYVSSGMDIVSLASIAQLQVDIRVPEHYLAQIAVGTPIQLQLDAQKGQVFSGQVHAISPMIDEQGRSVVLRALVPNSEGQLRPGQFVRLSVDLDEVEGMMVPETAIAPAGQSQYVYKVADGGVAERVEVMVGIRRDGWVQVTGLAPDDLVITSGLQKIQNGSKISYQLPENTSN